MNTQSVTELLGNVDMRMTADTATLRLSEGISGLQAYEYLFVDYESHPHKQEFVCGINVHFADNLRQLTRKRPVLFTTDRHTEPHILYSDKPVPVHNTGMEELQVGRPFTVVPPMCVVPGAVHVNGLYVLQTVDLQRFAREFKQLAVWLNLFRETEIIVGSTTLGHSKEYWRRMYRQANDMLRNNSLWADLIRAVCRDSHADDPAEACRKVAEVTGRYWTSLLAPDTSPSGGHYKRPFTTGRQLLCDFQRGLEKIEEVDADEFADFGDELKANESECVRALEALVSSQLDVHDALGNLQAIVDTLKPINVGLVHKASSLYVKPTEKMDVILSRCASN